MPSVSQNQRGLIFGKRTQYGSKKNTPKKWKWVWDEGWENTGKLPKKKKKMIKETYVFPKFSEFMLLEGIEWSGRDVTKAPVIGKIITKPIGPFESKEYNVVEILQGEKGDKTYICNFWYKEYKRIPQLVHEEHVEKFIPL